MYDVEKISSFKFIKIHKRQKKKKETKTIWKFKIIGGLKTAALRFNAVKDIDCVSRYFVYLPPILTIKGYNVRMFAKRSSDRAYECDLYQTYGCSRVKNV